MLTELMSTNYSAYPPLLQKRYTCLLSTARTDFAWIQKNLQAIEEIQKTLQSVKSALPVTEPNIGQNYAVLHPLYQQWYRARLEQEQSEGLVDCHSVTFMDYGDVQKVPLSALRLLPPMIRCIPPMSSLCSFRQPLSPLPLDPEIEERLRNELRKCTEGILCRVVMFPVKKGSDRFLVDSLFAISTDVIEKLKSNCNSTIAVIRFRGISFLSLYLEYTKILFKKFIQQ
jgi:hypothetical protein